MLDIMVLHGPALDKTQPPLPGDERLVLTLATALLPATTDHLPVPAPCLVQPRVSDLTHCGSVQCLTAP